MEFSMKYYIIAGEASGDLYGSKLIDEIFSIDEKADIRFWGGDNMIKSGGYNVKHIKELAFMGFYEVLKNIKTIISNINFCKNDIKEFNPDKIPGATQRTSRDTKTQKRCTEACFCHKLKQTEREREKEREREREEKCISSLFQFALNSD